MGNCVKQKKRQWEVVKNVVFPNFFKQSQIESLEKFRKSHGIVIYLCIQFGKNNKSERKAWQKHLAVENSKIPQIILTEIDSVFENTSHTLSLTTGKIPRRIGEKIMRNFRVKFIFKMLENQICRRDFKLFLQSWTCTMFAITWKSSWLYNKTSIIWNKPHCFRFLY